MNSMGKANNNIFITIRYQCYYVIAIITKFILSLIFPLREKNANDNINILILSYFNLGDIICDTPSLRAIRKNWPDANIHILVRRNAGVKMMKECPYVNSAEIITSDKDTWISYFQQLIRLRKMRFDISFQLVRPFVQYRKTSIPYIIGTPIRYGIVDRKTEKIYKHCFTSYTYVEGKTSRKYESIKIVSLCGIKNINAQTCCWIPESYELLLMKKIDIAEKYIIIHPGASLETKCWPKEKFINFINYVTENYPFKIYLTGVSNEDNLLQYIKSHTTAQLKVLNNLSIYEFWTLIKHSNAVITNDTGTLHFAIAQNTNIIAVFGPTYPDYAVGTDIPDNCVIIRGTVRKCRRTVCPVFRAMNDSRKNLIYKICDKSDIVCTDIVTEKIVEFFFDRFFSCKQTNNNFLPNNFQGFDPLNN